MTKARLEWEIVCLARFAAGLIVALFILLPLWAATALYNGVRTLPHWLRARLRPSPAIRRFSDPAVRRIVREVLYELGKPLVREGAEIALYRRGVELVARLESIGTHEAVEALLLILRQPEASRFARGRAIIALGRIGSPEAVAAIQEVVDLGERWRRDPPPLRMRPRWWDRWNLSARRCAQETVTREFGRRWAILRDYLRTGEDTYWLTRSQPHGSWEMPIFLDTPAEPRQLLLELASGARDLEEFTRDSDRDGLTDVFEAYIGTDPHDPDSDRDGVPDGLDGNPLTPPHDPTDLTEIRQAVFLWWAIECGQRALICVPRDSDVARQEYHGMSGWIVPIGEKGPYDAVLLPDIEVNRTGPDTATARIPLPRLAPPEAQGSAELRRAHGRWVVVYGHFVEEIRA